MANYDHDYLRQRIATHMIDLLEEAKTAHVQEPQLAPQGQTPLHPHLLQYLQERGIAYPGVPNSGQW